MDATFGRELILAAGLHDVAAPGLGHLFEEGCALADITFDHEQRLREVFLDEGNIYFQAYEGRELGFRHLARKHGVLPQDVFDALVGRGRCGAAINGSIDLDNIDNVTRMLSRLGKETDAKKVQSFTELFVLENDSLALDTGRHDLFHCLLHFDCSLGMGGIGTVVALDKFNQRLHSIADQALAHLIHDGGMHLEMRFLVLRHITWPSA